MKKMKFRGNTKGFTLVELIVIICIIGFLAAIVTPNILTRISRQKRYKAVEACKQAVSAANQLYDDSVVYKNTFTADSIAKSAGLNGDVKVEIANGEVVHLFYKDGNESVLYCRYYDEVDTDGKHVHEFGTAYTDPYVCDGTTTLPAHTELYNYIDDMDAINYYETSVDDVLPEFGDDSGIEYDTETTTAGTTPTSSDGTGETTTSDGNTEPTTAANASKPFVFDPNVDYSWGGDGVTRMYKIVTDMLDSEYFQTATNVIDKSWISDNTGKTLQLQNGSVPAGMKWAEISPGQWGPVEQEPLLSVSQCQKYITSYKVGNDYYVCLDGSVPSSGINLFDQNSSMTIVDWDGTTKTVKQNPIRFLNVDSNGNYIKTSPEDYATNINRMLVSPTSIIDNIENAMSNVATNEASQNSSKVIKVTLTDDRVCSRRYVSPSDNYKWHVITYEGTDRAVSEGDVYVDPTTGTIEIYWNSNGNGLGWFPIGYYPGYEP